MSNCSSSATSANNNASYMDRIRANTILQQQQNNFCTSGPVPLPSPSGGGATGATGPTGPSSLIVGVGPTGQIIGSTTYPNINTLIFDSNSDFSVSNDNPGVAFVSLNSTFKYWYAEGNTAPNEFLTAVGIDKVNFVGTNGITISMDPTQGPQQVTIGLTGATGVIGVTGTNYGDYIFWGNSGWTVGSTNISIGASAGQYGQQNRAVAIGAQAGQTEQQIRAVAIGTLAGQTGQQQYSVAIGANAGQYGQKAQSVAIGYSAGYTGQEDGSVAIGAGAGQNTQLSGAVAIGAGAGAIEQKKQAVAIGTNAGRNGQSIYAVAIGSLAGYTGQEGGAVAIGAGAGQYTQLSGAVAIGNLAGYTGQEGGAVAIGTGAGFNNQEIAAVAIGPNAGSTGQQGYAVALGGYAGYNGQGTQSVAIGYQAGQNAQHTQAVAIGAQAGSTGQKGYAVAMGFGAGQIGQGENAVAIGIASGQVGQKNSAVAIGPYAGSSTQGVQAVAIGNLAGSNGQGQNAVAIGTNAGKTNQPDNSIILNASGTILNGDASAFYVNPIRLAGTAGSTGLLWYNSGTSEIAYNTSKTFVIDHPLDKDRHLVHACLEGPEAGVYYRGTCEITNNTSTTIDLPAYAGALAKHFTISVTQIYDESNLDTCNYKVSKVKNGSFTVYGKNGEFFWVVYGERLPIDVEPLKSETDVKGYGPYKWI